jgi:hypothetical protein|tara:strand:+ start:395 stop:514 length:120 start_codon:yes stop_codon:yes gene_type:complete
LIPKFRDGCFFLEALGGSFAFTVTILIIAPLAEGQIWQY